MRHSLYIVIAAAAILGGCTHALELPPGFVELDEANRGPYDFRAVSADGVVIASHTVENAKNGTLDFWVQAVRTNLTDRGYKFLAAEDVMGGLGRTGKLLTFHRDKGGQKFAYTTALFVSPREVLITEAGGKAEAVEGQKEAIYKSLLSVK